MSDTVGPFGPGGGVVSPSIVGACNACAGASTSSTPLATELESSAPPEAIQSFKVVLAQLQAEGYDLLFFAPPYEHENETVTRASPRCRAR